jgi:hypothetical protein
MDKLVNISVELLVAIIATQCKTKPRNTGGTFWCVWGDF